MKSKKPTYKDIEQQLMQFAKIITQLSNLYMIMEGDVREIKDALIAHDILKNEEIEESPEPTQANPEDYFPKSEEKPQE